MLKTGCVVLSLWTVLNLIPSAWILLSTGFLDGDSPAITQILTAEEVATLSNKVRASINSVAVYANGLNSAFCLTAFFVIWRGLHGRSSWAFYCLVVGFSTALLAGFGSDQVLGTLHPEVNIISSLIIVFGLTFAAIGLFGQRQPS